VNTVDLDVAIDLSIVLMAAAAAADDTIDLVAAVV
jgi:hypothetical protein